MRFLIVCLFLRVVCYIILAQSLDLSNTLGLVALDAMVFWYAIVKTIDLRDSRRHNTQLIELLSQKNGQPQD